MELGFEGMALLERCPHFRGCYASMGLGPKEVSQWSKVMTSLTVSDLKYSRPLNWSNVHHLRFQPVLSLPVL